MTLIQTFKVILHAPPDKSTEDEQVERVLRVISVLREFGPSVSPAYEQAYSKKRAIAFDYTPERVRELIRKNVNREGRTAFPELGSVFGFFSEMNDDRMAGISFSIGAQKAPAINNVVLDFPIEPSVLDQKEPFTPDKVWGLFKQLVTAFQPETGAVSNAINRRRYWEIKRPPHDVRPISVDWMNYFGPTVLGAIGSKRLERLYGVHMEEFQDGLLLRLMDPPLDDNRADHTQRQKEVNRILGLLGN